MKKRLVAIALVGTMLFGMTACGQKQEAAPQTQAAETEEIAGLANDSVYDISQEELTEKTGITLAGNEDTTDVVYNAIAVSSENPIAEMQCKIADANVTERAAATNVVNLADAEDISGLYVEWTETENTVVANSEAVFQKNDDYSMVTWLDVVPGILYNVVYEGSLNAQDMATLAESLYVPMQGEVGDVDLANDCKYDITAEELLELTGIELKGNEMTGDVTFNAIAIHNEHPIAEMTFKMGDANVCLRVAETDATKLADVEDISGMYVTWTETEDTVVAHCDAKFEKNDDFSMLTWLDVVPGLQYSMLYEGSVNAQDLTTLAESIFVPAQGNAE